VAVTKGSGRGHHEVDEKRDERETNQNMNMKLYGDDKAASRPDRFAPREISSTRWIGGWVGPTAGLDAVEKRDNITETYRHGSDMDSTIALHVSEIYTASILRV
jgi:hypothetical protein